MKSRFKNFYMKMAKETAELSHATRLKVGAIIVKDGNIVSFGYNGTPKGWSNECEYEEGGELKTYTEVLHAEMNCILKLAREGGGGNGAELFCTHSPCIECAKAIASAGISKVYYSETYRKDEGIKFLEKFGVRVEQLGHK